MVIDTQLAISTIKPLLIFIGAMTTYAILIFKFYHFLAKKNIVNFNVKKFESENSAFNQFLRLLNYTIEYMVLAPISILIWFIMLTVMLTFLTNGQEIETIMLIAISIIGTTRVAAHYNEALSSDLAKMLPFALLGVFLVDMTIINIEESVTMIKTLLSHSTLLIHYLTFIVLLELILRLITAIIYTFTTDNEIIVDKKDQ